MHHLLWHSKSSIDSSNWLKVSWPIAELGIKLRSPSSSSCAFFPPSSLSYTLPRVGFAQLSVPNLQVLRVARFSEKLSYHLAEALRTTWRGGGEMVTQKMHKNKIISSKVS